MTERLYYNDPALLDFEAEVTASGRHEGKYFVTLDRSAFYPTSGGQPFDTGRLNGVEICEVVETDEGEVLHLAESEIAPVGQRVIGLVDKERRRRNSRNHTGQHILSAAAYRLFGLETKSVHLGDEYGAIEFDTESLDREQVDQLETTANDVIADNVEIEIIFAEGERMGTLPLRKPPPREGKLRIMRIGQYDYVACGGTHCTTSGGVGLIKIIATEKMRGRVMIKYLAGSLALRDYRQRFDVTDQLAREFTCHPTDLPVRVAKLNTEQRDLRARLEEMQKQLLPTLMPDLCAQAAEVAGNRVVVAVAPDLEMPGLTRLLAMLADEIGGLAVLLYDNRLLLATAPESSLHAGNLARKIADACGLKGGGNERNAQLGGADPKALEDYRDKIGRILADD